MPAIGCNLQALGDLVNLFVVVVEAMGLELAAIMRPSSTPSMKCPTG